MLIREAPATELVVATRLLVFAAVLAPSGRIVGRVGSEVVYVAGRGTAPRTLTPYDVAAVRVSDGLVLSGDPPDDVARFLEALRAAPEARAAADAASGGLVTAPSVRACVEALAGRPWEALAEEALVAGALVGALPPAEETAG